MDNPKTAFSHVGFFCVVLIVATFGLPVVDGSKNLVNVFVDSFFIIVADKRLLCRIEQSVDIFASVGFGM